MKLTLTFTPEDVRSVFPAMTIEEAARFLEANYKTIQELLVEEFHQIIESI